MNGTPRPEGSPESLLARVGAERDRGAFAELFRHFAPRLKGHLQGRGMSAATADELVQEAMISVWRHASQFDPARGSASTWMYAITRNALVNHVRRERRPEPEPGDPAMAGPDGSAEHPEDQYLVGERQRIIAAALARLPLEQAATLHDAYYAGRTLQQIADEQAVPLGTVKTRVRLALAKLRDAFGGGSKP